MQMTVRRGTYIQPVHFIHLIAQLIRVLGRSTLLRVHQENVTGFRSTKVTTGDIAMDKPGHDECVGDLHLRAKCLIALLVFRNGVAYRFQSKELENPPRFVEAV